MMSLDRKIRKEQSLPRELLRQGPLPDESPVEEEQRGEMGMAGVLIPAAFPKERSLKIRGRLAEVMKGNGHLKEVLLKWLEPARRPMFGQQAPGELQNPVGMVL